MWWFSSSSRARRRFFRVLTELSKSDDLAQLSQAEESADTDNDRLLIRALYANMLWYNHEPSEAVQKFSSLYAEAKRMDGALAGYIKRFALYYICLSRGDYAAAKSHEQNAKSMGIDARVRILLPIPVIYNVPYSPPSISASA